MSTHHTLPIATGSYNCVCNVRSSVFEQAHEFIFGELEPSKISAQDGLVQTVSRVRLIEGDGIWAARGIEEVSC